VKQTNLCTNCTQRGDLSGIRAQKRNLAGIRVQRDVLDTTRVRFVRVRGWIHPGATMRAEHDDAGSKSRRTWLELGRVDSKLERVSKVFSWLFTWSEES
jgi:hypothetical protein